MKRAAFPFSATGLLEDYASDDAVPPTMRPTVRPPADRPSRIRELATKRDSGPGLAGVRLREELAPDVCGIYEPPSFDAVLDLLEAGNVTAALAIADSLIDSRERPRQSLSADEIAAMDLDHRELFVLSLIDGESSIAEVFDETGMPIVAALHAVCTLFARGVLTMR